MVYALLAELVLVVHLAFVVFVVAGGLLVGVSPRWSWLHLPALAWAVLLEWRGWICPLTPLEHWLRQAANQAGAGAGVVERFLMPLLYPLGLTREDQAWLAAAVLAINAAIYGGWCWRIYRR